MRISDWISDVCSSDLIGKACHLASKRFLASSRRFSQDLLGCHLIFEEHRLVVHHGLFATVKGDDVDGKNNPVPVREHVRLGKKACEISYALHNRTLNPLLALGAVPIPAYERVRAVRATCQKLLGLS